MDKLLIILVKLCTIPRQLACVHRGFRAIEKAFRRERCAGYATQKGRFPGHRIFRLAKRTQQRGMLDSLGKILL